MLTRQSSLFRLGESACKGALTLYGSDCLGEFVILAQRAAELYFKAILREFPGNDSPDVFVNMSSLMELYDNMGRLEYLGIKSSVVECLATYKSRYALQLTDFVPINQQEAQICFECLDEIRTKVKDFIKSQEQFSKTVVQNTSEFGKVNLQSNSAPRKNDKVETCREDAEAWYNKFITNCDRGLYLDACYNAYNCVKLYLLVALFYFKLDADVDVADDSLVVLYKPLYTLLPELRMHAYAFEGLTAKYKEGVMTDPTVSEETLDIYKSAVRTVSEVIDILLSQ